MATTINFNYVVDSNSPCILCEDIPFLRDPNLAQKPLYLVCTVLNWSKCLCLTTGNSTNILLVYKATGKQFHSIPKIKMAVCKETV